MDCVIYPFAKGYQEYLECLMLKRPDLEIKQVVIPRGWEAPEQGDARTVLAECFESAIADVDAAIVIDNNRQKYWPREGLIAKIRKALLSNRDVICGMNLGSSEIDEFTEIAQSRECNFIYCGARPDCTNVIWNFQPQSCIIVGVGNALRGLDESETIAGISKRLSEQGYRVSGVSANPMLGPLGFTILPEDLFLNCYPFENVVTRINRIFTKIQLSEHPDIIVFQYPDALMKYSNFCPEDYGASGFIFSQAVSLDYLVLQSPLDMCGELDTPRISQQFIHRYGHGIDCIAYHPYRVDEADSLEAEETVLVPDEGLAYEDLPNVQDGVLLVSSADRSFCDQIVQDIIQKLAGGAEE